MNQSGVLLSSIAMEVKQDTQIESTCRELKTKATLVYGNEKMEVVAQWDTGASGSCISQRVIQVLKPVRTGLW